jgi:hypothetical protein
MANKLEQVPNDDIDELDVMNIPECLSATIPASSFLSISAPPVEGNRRRVRLRVSETAVSTESVLKKRRASSIENCDVLGTKKVKLKDKKAVSYMFFRHWYRDAEPFV